MLSRLTFVGLVVSALGLVVACSSDPSSDGSSGAASGSSSSSGSSGSSANKVTGTIGGKAVTMKSGFGFVAEDGSLDLVLSSEDGLCASVEKAKLHAGETIVQLYGLKGTAPGAFTSENSDVKYATVSSTCPSGQPVGEVHIAGASRATSTTVTLTALSATAVQGTVDITFEDGSSIKGELDVPKCSTTVQENSFCF